MDEPIAFTESSIVRCLTRRFGMFDFSRNLCVDNVSWGLGLPWEADLIVMSGSGYLTEVEVKISVSDLKRDAAKHKHTVRLAEDGVYYTKLIRRFYYAMPEAVWKKAGDRLLPIPGDAGVILITVDPGRPGSNILPKLVASEVRKAKVNMRAEKLDLKRRYELARLGCLRYWDRK